MRVSELARRSGVPATTLRYYEGQGLLPAARTGAGYRRYDERALDRLGFITTAKGLGLTLAEIRRLLDPWQHGGCRDVRAELAPLLDARIGRTRERIAELEAFRSDLEAARDLLGTIDRDGPCDRSCGFQHRRLPAPRQRPGVPDLPGPGPVDPDAARHRAGAEHVVVPRHGRARTPVRAGSEPGAAGHGTARDRTAERGTVPIACSLDGTHREDRVVRWRAALGAATARHAVPGGLRVELDPDRVDLPELARLAAAEARCCPFLTLRLCFDPGPALEIHAPADARAVVADLFGRPTP